MREEAYKNGNKIGYSQTSAMLTDLKRSGDFTFLKAVDSIALQQSLRDLDRGYVNFFQKRASHPTFKSKHNNHQSYRTINQGDNIRIAGKYVRLPKLGFVKVRQSMEVGKINNVTIERTPTGKYFAVLNVDFEPQLQQNNGAAIGIDVGIKEFYSDSNGNVVSNPKHLEKSMHKLIREHRKLSRKEKGSNNRNKQRVRVALVHEKITNQRKDFLQKRSTMLIRENQTICIEDLKVKNMMRNHKLAKYISSVSWSKFYDMLTYKATWYGNDIVKIPTMYPSSQTCSCCGYKNPLVKNLAIRKWECPECHATHDRDTNASVNILNKGLQMQSA
ncbi:transposase [Hungatella hathewayi]|nr:transposase [Hungatella hathewayi]GKH11773.1 transposase [Hungatella hathewayi]